MGHAPNYRSKKRKFAGNRYSNVRVKNDSQTVPDNVVDDENPKVTASSSKLEGYKNNFSNETSSETNSEIFGNRIINVKTLISVFAILCCPEGFSNNLLRNEDSRFGSSSNFCIKCKNCNFMKGFSSTVKVNNRNQLNTLVVYTLRLIGKGYNGGRKLFCRLDLPLLSKNTFRRQEMKVKQAASEAAIESMKASANNIMLLKGVQKDTTRYGVSMDGTWLKRGYSSFNGCVSCISVDNGKVLDIEIMSNFCRMCNNMPNSKYCSKHVYQNQKAYRIFERSEVTRNLQYTQYYGDGDSTAFDAVKDIYGENTVTKLECIGQVQKRVGSRLRKLKKIKKGTGRKGEINR
ncbi:hypothetical protein AVEN_240882-1 [Araneus ventricosus]|uniref:Mutator-like transposase domain-containing protein n=1 Tax=Araneus ventricosus TaxID=182803 RepID=A0A4Y2M2N4_ARAVE|nr:hypothetical protein AVEN_240882-1 [Araneus ventricosus]